MPARLSIWIAWVYLREEGISAGILPDDRKVCAIQTQGWPYQGIQLVYHLLELMFMISGGEGRENFLEPRDRILICRNRQQEHISGSNRNGIQLVESPFLVNS
jgi:hypothetical protein